MVGKKFTLLLGILALSFLFVGFTQACDCPLDSNDYDYIVTFNAGLQSNSNSPSIYSSDVVDISIPSGNYVVTLIAEDGYDTRVNTSQPNEQYFLSFIKNSVEVAQSSSTSDLQDNVVYAQVNEIVNTSLSLPNGADSVQAIHSEYLNVPTSSPNSLTAVCIGLNEVVEPYCGDGLWDPCYEECDYNALPGTPGYNEYCNQDCEIEEPEPFCGDGNLDAGEECDDGNNVDGDGCSATCDTECPECPYCGDGIINQIWEECDDGNNFNGDGCSASCRVEDGCSDCKEAFEWSFCESNWECSGWSECYNGIMTRECVDSNNCDSIFNKPAEQTGCDSLSSVYVEENGNYIWVFIGIIIFLILLIVLVNLFK